MSIVHATDERTIMHRASRLALAAAQPGTPATAVCENFRSRAVRRRARRTAFVPGRRTADGMRDAAQ
jgi:hypothetical protein